ncbi:MAG TPA: PriCT-2 domain-containing protein [Herpetosiphonaceae bacterium]|nr:PriCT-2 domain-containing protein [Herpetosiphonaceae bacterium]
MMASTLTPEARRLINFLHRGGAYGYLWGVQGDEKITRWFEVGQPANPFNSRHNNYLGVHPTTARGNEHQRAKQGERDIAAVNCLFGEFDAKHLIQVTDEEAEQEQRAQRTHGKELTLDDARGRVQERRFLENPEPYKGQLLSKIEALDPRPSYCQATGGGYHALWFFAEPFILDSEAKRRRAKHVQAAWVARIKSDDDAKDLARVLRVPGTRNFKKAYAPNFPTVQVVWADYGLLYSFDELAALLPPEPAPKERAARPKPAEAAPPAASSSDHDFDTIADAARNLGRLASWRRDKYSTWIDVGMALRELGSIGYELWEKWSKLSSKYNPGDCAEKWPTFKAGDECDGITLASLARWAHEDEPEAETPAIPEQIQREITHLRQRVIWEQKVLYCKGLKPTEKGVLVGLYDIIAAQRHLGGNDGRVPLDYDHAAQVLGTSKTTVGNVVDIGEKIKLWRKDPEIVAGDDGYEIKHMRLELLPTYDEPPKQADLERKKHGGARPGAGRKPKCRECPAGTVHRMVTKRNVSYYCSAHGLIKEEALPDVIEDYVPDKIQDETREKNVVTPVSSSASLTETDTEIQDETEDTSSSISLPHAVVGLDGERLEASAENQDETGTSYASPGPATHNPDYRQSAPDAARLPTWEEIQYLHADRAEAQGDIARAQFLRRAATPTKPPGGTDHAQSRRSA